MHTNDGKRVKHTPSTALDAGAVVVLESMIGIAIEAIPANVEGTLEIEGIFELPRASVFANWQAGKIAYWHTIDSNVTAVAGSNRIEIGKLSQYSPRTDSTIQVKIKP